VLVQKLCANFYSALPDIAFLTKRGTHWQGLSPLMSGDMMSRMTVQGNCWIRSLVRANSPSPKLSRMWIDAVIGNAIGAGLEIANPPASGRRAS
jgi:hypothetical protein